jgi:hypothetical protein
MEAGLNPRGEGRLHEPCHQVLVTSRHSEGPYARHQRSRERDLGAGEGHKPELAMRAQHSGPGPGCGGRVGVEDVPVERPGCWLDLKCVEEVAASGPGALCDRCVAGARNLGGGEAGLDRKPDGNGK